MKVKTEKKCNHCKTLFKLFTSLDKYCSPDCKKAGEKAKGKRIGVNKVSSKQVEILKIYEEKRKRFLYQNPICPVTGLKATEIHHMRKKRGFADELARLNNIPLYIDERYFLAVSRRGHELIEDNPEWAYSKGYSIKNNN